MSDDGAQDLRQQLDRAARTAREAHRDTTRLIRLLTVIGRPARPEQLVDDVLAVLSDVYTADVVCLLRADDRHLVITEACGLPEDDPDLGVRLPLAPQVEQALAASRPLAFDAGPPLLPGATGTLATLALRSVAWVPLTGPQADGQLLLLARVRRAPFAGTELDVLHSVAARLESSLAEVRRAVALERLAREGHALQRHLDRAATFADAVRLLQELSGARTAWVLGRRGDGWEVEAATGPGSAGAADAAGLAADLAAAAGRADAGGVTTAVSGDRALLAVPVVPDAGAPAVLLAAHPTPFRYPTPAVEAVTILAGHLASALTQEALYRSVRQGEASLRLITDSISDLVAVVDADGHLRYASPSFDRQLGLPVAGLLGRTLLELVHPLDVPVLAGALADPEGAPTVECRLATSTGGWVWVEAAVRTAVTAEGSVVLSARIVNERKRLEAELRHRATHDALTGMANRAVATQRLEAELAAPGAGDVGLLFCDIDHFKSVNDRLGHEAGDQLLRQVAERLRHVVRPGDLVARFGGDEFVVVIGHTEGLAGVHRIGQRVIEAMKEPFALLGEPVTVSFSVGGVATRRGTSGTATSLLRDADAAMYEAKATGRGRLAVFDEVASSRSLDRLDLRRDLERGIDLSQLSLHYQPIVTLASRRVTAFEALLRWDHPTRGPIPPDVFVPLAEETGALVDLGSWILRTALRRLAVWRRQWQLPDLEMHVNVSPRQLAEPDVAAASLASLRRAGVEPSGLWLEITERGPVTGQVVESLERLRAGGVRLALDDFGVSSSNLELLRLVTPDCLKIDRSFVGGLVDGLDADRAVVRAMISMGEWMKVGVVAEGVETAEQLAVLRQMGCPAAQGYLLGRPAGVEETSASHSPARVHPV